MHALDWIEQHGRFMRTIGADLLRRRLERQKGECTWCAGQVPAGRYRWCSGACLEEFNCRCDVNRIRHRVRRRDNGVCARCGGKRPWHADHIVAVEQGGGLCDLAGYQTLCEDCHAEKTARHAAERALARRALRGRANGQLALFG